MMAQQGYDGGDQNHGCHEDQENSENTKDKINGGYLSSSNPQGPKMVKKIKITANVASQRHAVSERKRRNRINQHYNSLRQLLPRLLKTDNASVLTETLRRLKELRTMVADVAPLHDVSERFPGDISRRFFIPGENDELTISYCDGVNKTAVRATICCEDRPGLNRDLTAAIQSVRGKAVTAEMATVGGRTKVEVVVEWQECGAGDVGLLRRALRAVVENRVLSCTGLLSYGYTEPDWFGLGRRLVDSGRPKVCDPIENGHVDGLTLRSY